MCKAFLMVVGSSDFWWCYAQHVLSKKALKSFSQRRLATITISSNVSNFFVIVSGMSLTLRLWDDYANILIFYGIYIVFVCFWGLSIGQLLWSFDHVCSGGSKTKNQRLHEIFWGCKLQKGSFPQVVSVIKSSLNGKFTLNSQLSYFVMDSWRICVISDKFLLHLHLTGKFWDVSRATPYNIVDPPMHVCIKQRRKRCQCYIFFPKSHFNPKVCSKPDLICYSSLGFRVRPPL